MPNFVKGHCSSGNPTYTKNNTRAYFRNNRAANQEIKTMKINIEYCVQ